MRTSSQPSGEPSIRGLPELLTRHVAGVLQRVLRGLPEKIEFSSRSRSATRSCRCSGSSTWKRRRQGERVPSPAEALLSILQARATPAGDTEVLLRPTSRCRPATSSSTRAASRASAILEREIPSADRIDLLCAFVRWNGCAAPAPAASPLGWSGSCASSPPPTPAPPSAARSTLWSNGRPSKGVVRDAVRRAFTPRHGCSIARPASRPLTSARRTCRSRRSLDGVEWNVRLSQVTTPDILDKFAATFDSYWEEPRVRGLRPRPRRRAIRSRSRVRPWRDRLHSRTGFDVEPYPHQSEILDKLRVERERHDRYRNLVVAATGTGKTIVAALDYRRLRDEMGDAAACCSSPIARRS